MQKTIRAATLALGTCALAGFSANASAAWTFSNEVDAADGSISGSYPAFTITGSNNGVGENTAFYTQPFATSQVVTFTWQYASADSNTAVDPAGWVLDGVETQLSIDGDMGTTSSGTTSVTVLAGHTFGFYVFSSDSLFGAGMLAINEDLPGAPPPPAIPEPANAALMMAGLAAVFAAVRRRQSD